MTTAHRPTWKPALGMSNAANKGFIPTRSYSARDLPGYLTLKDRKIGQGSIDELKEHDFKAELLKRQAELKNKELKTNQAQAIQYITEDNTDLILTSKSKIRRPGQQDQEQQAAPAIQEVNPFPEDEDSVEFCKDNAQINEDQEDDDDDDSDDNNEALLREFEKVKQQREREEKKKLQQKAKFSAANRETELLKGNPLLGSAYSLSKRWYEDTVFKNQAKRVEEKKSYVNDNVRSEFHRKFINKYVMR